MSKAGTNSLNYTISKTWDSDTPADNATVHLVFQNISTETETGLLIEIDAPFYNDPIVPPELPVGSTDKLWNYEVVEVFFLSESEGQYLETEFAPRGHYLLLTLDTDRNILKYELPLNDSYTAEVNEDTGRWKGRVVVPWEYLPKNVTKFNAYAIHKSDPNRVYMSLFPVGKGEFEEPNFHRLEYFQDIDFGDLRGGGSGSSE